MKIDKAEYKRRMIEAIENESLDVELDNNRQIVLKTGFYLHRDNVDKPNELPQYSIHEGK